MRRLALPSDLLTAAISFKRDGRLFVPMPRLGMYCRAKLSVVNADGSIASETPWLKNLITNYGLNTNGLVTHQLADCMKYAVLGTGATNTEYDSLTDTAQQAGLNVTFDQSDVNAAVGRWIVWDSGQEARLVSNSGGNVWVVDRTQSVGSGQYTIYYTDLNSFGTILTPLPDTKRSLWPPQTGSSGCGTITGNDALGFYQKIWRTYDFTAEVANVTYNSMGFSWSGTLNDGKFWSIINIVGGVSLLATQQARIRYELFCYPTPQSLTAQTAAIPEAPFSNPTGHDIITDYASNLSSISAINGGSGLITNGMDDMGAQRITVSDDTSTPVFGVSTTQGTTSYNNAVAAAYVDDNFYRDFEYTFLISEANQSIRKLLLGTAGNYYCFIFDSSYTKANTHKLRLKFRKSWKRIWVP